LRRLPDGAGEFFRFWCFQLSIVEPSVMLIPWLYPFGRTTTKHVRTLPRPTACRTARGIPFASRRRLTCFAFAGPPSGSKREIERRLFIAENSPRCDLYLSARKKKEVEPKVAIPAKPKVFNVQIVIRAARDPDDATAAQIDQRAPAIGI
jgi:hypothetical protein